MNRETALSIVALCRLNANDEECVKEILSMAEKKKTFVWVSYGTSDIYEIYTVDEMKKLATEINEGLADWNEDLIPVEKIVTVEQGAKLISKYIAISISQSDNDLFSYGSGFV